MSTDYKKTALTVCSGFRTIPDEATYMVARIMWINIFADEMAGIYGGFGPSSNRHLRNAEREESLNRW